VSTSRTWAEVSQDPSAPPIEREIALLDEWNLTLIELSGKARLCATLERELAESRAVIAESRAVIAELLAKAVPVAAESGDAGMVYVEMTEAKWQDVVAVILRAKAFRASGEGML
jgi:hypothetical protein